MIQQNGELYQVSIGTLKTNAISLLSGPTNFFLVERENQLFSVENPFAQAVEPSFVLSLDTSGLGNSATAYTITVGAPSNSDTGQAPRAISLKADNTVEGTRWFSKSGDTATGLVGTVNSTGVTKIVIVGKYSYVKFKNSKALTTVKWTGGTNGWTRMFPGQSSLIGHEMFSECSKLTHVFGMSGYGDAMPAGMLKDMQDIFRRCTVFNGDLSNWDTSNVTTTQNAFEVCSAYQGTGIGGWDMGKCTNMASMFTDSAFNTNINGWNTSAVKTFESTFKGCASFNQPMNNWVQSGDAINVTPITSHAMVQMFYGTTAFNQDLTGWCVSNFSQPQGFADLSGLAVDNYPVWGTCP